MLVRDIALNNDKLGLKVRVIKSENKRLIGKEGDLTFPFGRYYLGEIGLFLDTPIMDCDTYNLGLYDEVEFI